MVECQEFKPQEVCEALGEDDIWYPAKITAKNPDGTFSCKLEQYPTIWDPVLSHNLRKLAQRNLPRDSSGDNVAQKPSASAKKERKVMFDETFTEFDERSSGELRRRPFSKCSVVRFSEKEHVKEELSIQVDSVLDDYRNIHRALSSIGSTFSENAIKLAEKENQDGKVKVTITRTKEKKSERKLTILLPESPTAPACANPFSWFFTRKKKMSVPSVKRNRRQKVETSLQETIEDDARRGSNLYHVHSKEDWSEEDRELYQNEIEAEINRLRNASSAFQRVTSSVHSRRSDTSFADAYMSLSRFRLSDDSLPAMEFERRRRPESVLESDTLPYTKRLQISNQWDVDSTMIAYEWKKGDKVEVWVDLDWKSATITDCLVENNTNKLLVSCIDRNGQTVHKVSRFGHDIRPWGYLEADSDDESES